MAGTSDHSRFALAERVNRVGSQASCPPDGGFGGSAGYRITDRHVAKCVYSDAWHPAEETVGRVIESLLLCCRCRNSAARDGELVPADGHRAGPARVVIDGMSRPQ